MGTRCKHTRTHAGVNALGVSISFHMGNPAAHILTHTHTLIPLAQSQDTKTHTDHFQWLSAQRSEELQIHTNRTDAPTTLLMDRSYLFLFVHLPFSLSTHARTHAHPAVVALSEVWDTEYVLLCRVTGARCRSLPHLWSVRMPITKSSLHHWQRFDFRRRELNEVSDSTIIKKQQLWMYIYINLENKTMIHFKMMKLTWGDLMELTIALCVNCSTGYSPKTISLGPIHLQMCLF